MSLQPNKQLRKVVGRPIEELSVFDRIRRLQSSLKKMGLHQKQENDGEYIRRTVGAAVKK
jgi:hypothetical protein